MIKQLTSVKHTFTSAPGLAAFGAAVLLTPSARAMLMFFGIFLLLDYATGILAAWTERRKAPAVDNGEGMVESARQTGDGTALSTIPSPLSTKEPYFVSSSRLRASAAKVLGYLSTIAFAAFLDMVFFHGGVHLPGADRPPMTAAEIAIAACTAIEFLSNLENLKRAGFDLPGKLSAGAETVWRMVKKIRGEG